MHVVSLRADLTDADLIRALAKGSPWAPAMLYDRYAPHIARLLRLLLGLDTDLEDVFQDVFCSVFQNVETIHDPDRLKHWLTRVTVFKARQHLRVKRRRRWLAFWAPEQLPEVAVRPTHDENEALRRTYELLANISPDDRVPFVLQLLTNLELDEIADVCGVSLATAKRQIARAKQKLAIRASADPVLSSWVSDGGHER